MDGCSLRRGPSSKNESRTARASIREVRVASEEYRTGRAGVEGWRGAAQQGGSTAGRLTRKAHPWVDSRPSEDQAAFAARGRSVEGLALWLPSLSDPASVARPPPSAGLAR